MRLSIIESQTLEVMSFGTYTGLGRSLNIEISCGIIVLVCTKQSHMKKKHSVILEINSHAGCYPAVSARVSNV